MKKLLLSACLLAAPLTGQAIINLSPGTPYADVTADGTDVVNMGSGVTVNGNNSAVDNSTFNMWGGTIIGGNFYAQGQSTINLWAQDFSGSDLQPGIGGFASFDLNDLPTSLGFFKSADFDLTWADGSSEDFNFQGHTGILISEAKWTGTLNLYDTDFYAPGVVPEPSTYALIAGALGLGLALLRRRR